ncbi:MAG: hypothetical protein MJE68_00415 [Proteobacteria bacterium]|nr:hypothetical protein [Pseudomonadota bacterium]
MSSGKIIHPSGNLEMIHIWSTIKIDTMVHHLNLMKRIMLSSIIIGGKNWHPCGGSANPKNDTKCVLHSDQHAAAKFYFGDISGKPISPYPSANLSRNGRVISQASESEQ